MQFSGCLISILILLLILFLVKELWWLIVGIILIIIAIYFGNRIYETVKNSSLEAKKRYNPQMGEVFKVCTHCGAKVKVNETTCPYCKRALN